MTSALREPKCRTLVVEDHAVTHVSMRHVLAAAGYDVEAVGTLAEARKHLGAVQCLILDLELPDGRGTDLLREIRQRGLPVKVAIVTGTADDALLAEARSLRPDALFIKPFRPDTLLAWLRDAAGYGLSAPGGTP